MKIIDKKFPGGYTFNNFNAQPESRLILAGIPEHVIIPLKQGFGMELSPLVQTGDKVKAGQIIARDDDIISSPVHSSVNGIVEEIKKIKFSGEEIHCVIIRSDKTPDWIPLDNDNIDWKNLGAEKIEELLYLAGVTSLDSCGIPTHYKSSVISPEEVEQIIIHGIDSDVYNVSLSILLEEERFTQFIEGIMLLKKIMPKAGIHIVLNKKDTYIFNQINNHLSGNENIRLYSVKPKYPISRDEVLVPVILNKKFPYGFLPANIGVITLTVQSILHVYEAIVKRKPLIERIIALSGQGFKEKPHLKVRIGTRISEITESRISKDKEIRLVVNSPIIGKQIKNSDFPVGKDCYNIIALNERKTGETLSFLHPGFKKDSFSNSFLSKIFPFKKECNTNIHGEERACLSCSFCAELCPVGLFPNLLHLYIKKNMIDERLIKYKIQHCIECNLCTYVCLSKIPLAKTIIKGKEKLKKEGFDINDDIKTCFKLIGLNADRGSGK